MTSSNRRRAPAAAALTGTLADLAAALLAAGCATPAVPALPEVPQALRPGTELSLARRVGATGVQIYECASVAAEGAGAALWRWRFVAPEATLLDERGSAVGHHGAGPYWDFGDGRRVIGRVKASAPAPDATAIPWLLLDLRPADTATAAAGQAAALRSVQRIHTVGGLAPADGCSAAFAGRTLRVPYRADYLFYAPI